MQRTIRQNTNRQNLLQLLWLRLIAIIGQIITISIVHHILKIQLPLNQLFLVIMILAIISGLSFYRYEFQKYISDKSLFIELLLDVFALAAQIYFSGGSFNPFISLFLLQVIIGAILLKALYAWLITALTIFCYVGLSFKYQELTSITHNLHRNGEGDFFNLHLHGMLISYVFTAVLLLIFTTKIIKNLRVRDQKINLLKQKSLQKEQVIRIGLLATGAAHELSTPLTTISVIIADWKRTNLDKNLIEDIELIESQIGRCKKILTSILSSSGKIRSEEARLVSVKSFFDEMVSDWKGVRKAKNLFYNFTGKESKIIADNILSQAFFNILDNALEESPDFVAIDVESNGDLVKISIEDRGKGFDREILEKIGKPNFSTKNSSGLGLFLAINILEGMGGSLKIANLQNGGAKVLIDMPVKNL